MKRKIILSDCDGVLLDWRTGFLDWLPDHISDTLQMDALEHENFNNAFDYDQRHIDELAHEFNRSEAISRLAPWHDSVEYVKKLGELGFRFHICTAMGTNELCQQYREYNLYSLYGDLFDIVQLMPVGSSKASWLDQYRDSGYFWLEDHVGHAQDGAALGLKSVVVTDSSNSQYTDIDLPRTSEQKPWRDIYEMVLSEYQLKD
jgi:hypothetical protein